MADRPRGPLPDNHPVAIVLEPHELDAIRQAVTVYDFLVDGAVVAALELTDTTNDGGLTRQTLADLRRVHEKVVKAQEPMLRQMRAWMAENGIGGEAG